MMPKFLDPILFDSRMIERHLRKGLLTPEQVETHLASLEDASDNAEAIALELPERPTHQGPSPEGEREGG